MGLTPRLHRVAWKGLNGLGSGLEALEIRQECRAGGFVLFFIPTDNVTLAKGGRWRIGKERDPGGGGGGRQEDPTHILKGNSPAGKDAQLVQGKSRPALLGVPLAGGREEARDLLWPAGESSILGVAAPPPSSLLPLRLSNTQHRRDKSAALQNWFPPQPQISPSLPLWGIR